MKYLLMPLLMIAMSSFANETWERTRLELHKFTIQKMNSDKKLKSYNRRAETFYQKLELLVSAAPEVKKARETLAKASSAKQAILKKALEEAQAQFLKEGTIEGEEARELLESLDAINKKIYEELSKDEKFRQLQERLAELKH